MANAKCSRKCNANAMVMQRVAASISLLVHIRQKLQIDEPNKISKHQVYHPILPHSSPPHPTTREISPSTCIRTTHPMYSTQTLILFPPYSRHLPVMLSLVGISTTDLILNPRSPFYPLHNNIRLSPVYDPTPSLLFKSINQSINQPTNHLNRRSNFDPTLYHLEENLHSFSSPLPSKPNIRKRTQGSTLCMWM